MSWNNPSSNDNTSYGQSRGSRGEQYDEGLGDSNIYGKTAQGTGGTDGHPSHQRNYGTGGAFGSGTAGGYTGSGGEYGSGGGYSDTTDTYGSSGTTGGGYGGTGSGRSDPYSSTGGGYGGTTGYDQQTYGSSDPYSASGATREQHPGSGTGSTGSKPTMGEKVKGGLEKMMGKHSETKGTEKKSGHSQYGEQQDY